MEPLLQKTPIQRTIREYLMIILALFPFALMVNWIFVPQNVVGAGLTGICSIIYYATQGFFVDLFPEYGGSIPLWISSLTINTILLIIAALTVGWKFCVRTLVGALALAFWYRVIPMRSEPLIDDPVTACIVGGVIFGMSLGIVMLNNGSSGGTDIVAMMLQKYCKMTFSTGVLIADTIVVLAGLVVIGFGIGSDSGDAQGWQLSFYSLIAIYVSSRVLAYMLDGASYDRIIFIITSHHNEEFRKFILDELERSGTYIKTSGMYTNADKEMIFLVVPRHELAKVQRAVKEHDPQAFMTVANAYNTYGEGFKPLPEKHELENM